MLRPFLAFLLGFICVATITQAAPSMTNSSAQVANEGVLLAQRLTINFAGAGVTCADGVEQTTCTIPGGGASPLTTKGDLYTFSTVDDRKPVGADGECLKADSAQATGLGWSACAPPGAGLTFGEVQRLAFISQ